MSESTQRCPGCDDANAADTRPYLAAFDGGKAEIVYYCDPCAELAQVNWSGTVDWIRGPLDPSVHCFGCSLALGEEGPVDHENCSSLTHPMGEAAHA